jgi:hypothetical protein
MAPKWHRKFILSRLDAEDVVNPFRDIRFLLFQNVPVYIEGDSDGAMPEPAANDLDVNPVLQQRGCMAVTPTVKREVRIRCRTSRLVGAFCFQKLLSNVGLKMPGQGRQTTT